MTSWKTGQIGQARSLHMAYLKVEPEQLYKRLCLGMTSQRSQIVCV